MNYDSLHLSGRKTLVLGLGDTGLSAARWLAARGAIVSVADSRELPPHAQALKQMLPGVALHCGPFRDEVLQAADMLVASPGVPLAEPAVARAVQKGIETVGDVELFARALQGAPTKVIAITGSNGKSTVTAMCGAMSAAAGKKTCVAGNIGLPVLDALTDIEAGRMSEPEVWALELSSFQLETTASLDADAATVLNISEDHLDRYPGMEAYAAAKARIFSGRGVQVLNRDDARVMAMVIPGRRQISFGLHAAPGGSDFGLCDGSLCRGNEQLMAVADLPVAGLHNAANALAALALTTSVGLPESGLLQGLGQFKGLPHRVEFVDEIEGVRFYDDSKGTNVGATEAALSGMDRKVVVILGGDGKGQDFSPLKQAVAANARAAVLIGRDAPLIEKAIAGAGVPLEKASTLEAAVDLAFELAFEGDAVLLSPACASWDMFRNYAHRAEVFIQAVRALKNKGGGVPSPQPSPAGGEGANVMPKATK
jgi:UDP-N-acetylmuramoylalanine--D-glutamate ligase